jgi:hypothetical protein
VEHSLCPSGLAPGGWDQLEHRARAAAPAASRCAVERAAIVGDQARDWPTAVAAAWLRTESIEHDLCPSGLALGGRGQLENCASVGGIPAASRCAVERALPVGDQASVGVGAVAAV